MRKFGFLGTSVVYLFISNTAALVNYVFQIIITRSLGPADFSAVAAVTSMGPAFFAILAVIPPIVAKAILTPTLGQSSAERSREFVRIRIVLFGLSGAIIAAFVGMAPVLGHYLHLPSTDALLVYSVSIIASVAILYYTGILQAHQVFLAVATKDLFIAASKVGLTLILVVGLSYSVLGVLWAESLTAVLAAVGLGLYSRGHNRNLPVPETSNSPSTDPNLMRPLFRLALPVVVVSLITGLFTSVDLGLARHHLPSAEAGIYSAGASLGRVALYFSGALGVILFPRVLMNLESGRSSKRDLLAAAGVTLVASSLISLVVTAFGETIITLFYGSEYIGAGVILAIISWAMTAIAVSMVIFNYLLATERYWFIVPAGTVLGATYFSVAVFWHRNGLEVATVMLLGGLAMAIVATAFILIPKKRIKQEVPGNVNRPTIERGGTN